MRGQDHYHQQRGLAEREPVHQLKDEAVDHGMDDG
jgi:hypothetical protein